MNLVIQPRLPEIRPICKNCQCYCVKYVILTDGLQLRAGPPTCSRPRLINGCIEDYVPVEPTGTCRFWSISGFVMDDFLQKAIGVAEID